MFDITTCNPQAVTQFGQTLFNRYTDALDSFESAAQVLAETVYDAFYRPDGERAFALVRVYRFGFYDELLPELQARTYGNSDTWLSLMGTMGDEPAWRNRQFSNAHQIISPEDASPMFQAAVKHLGLPWVSAYDPADGPEAQEQPWYMRSFFVPEATHSPYIPDQTQFVEAYGIRSVIILGGTFRRHTGALLTLFSNTPLTDACRDQINMLAPYLITILSGYDERQHLWRAE